MRVNKQYLLINIDKQAQLAKREKTDSGIFLSPIYQYMLYNLQYGEILQIGEEVQKIFPEAKVGDVAIFHHMVEEKDINELEVMPNGDEHRIVKVSVNTMENQLYGIIQDGGHLVAHPFYIFLSTRLTPLKKTYSTFLELPEDMRMWEDEDLLRTKQGEIALAIKSLEQTAASSPDEILKIQIRLKVKEYNDERQKIADFLAAPKYAIGSAVAIHPKTSQEMDFFAGDHIAVQQDLLIPLDIVGNRFLLSYTKYIIGRLN